MDDRRTPSGLIIGIANDPLRAAIFLIFIVLFGLMILTGGLCIWPYLFSTMQVNGFDIGTAVGKLITLGGISGVVGMLFSFYLCWYHNWGSEKNFTLGKVFMLVYMVEMILSFILIGVMRVDMLGIADANSWTKVLSVLFNGMLGTLLCILPSALASIIGFSINRAWNASHS